jgi:ABC-type nitrate/sulfonate/bicarbonate transport system permease component
MFNDMFIGFIFGVIVGMLLSDLIWYLYVERELYPILAYIEDIKQKERGK